jgi:transposase
VRFNLADGQEASANGSTAFPGLALPRRRRADGGAIVREAAARFAISVASAVRIGQLARAGQGLEAKKLGGPRPLMLVSAVDEITARLASKSNWTVRALAADLRAAGIAASHDTVWRFMRRQGRSFKKTLPASGTERPDLTRPRTVITRPSQGVGSLNPRVDGSHRFAASEPGRTDRIHPACLAYRVAVEFGLCSYGRSCERR